MDQFKKGQIVYVSDDNQGSYILRHFSGYEPDDAYPYKTSSDYQKALKGIQSGSFKYCLSVENYHYRLSQPKDKDLVWAWDDEIRYARTARFYDAHTDGTFYPSTGGRRGYSYDNYEVIPRDQWPQWAIDAYEELKY